MIHFDTLKRRYIEISPILVFALLLNGCGNSKDAELIKADLKNTQMELHLAMNDLKIKKQEIKLVQADLAALNERVDRLELPTKRVVKSGVEQRLPNEQIEPLKKAISNCVQQVKNLAKKDDFSTKFFSEFDAYYNPASGRVQNNAIYQGSMPAVYEFNKCMSSLGFPLS